MLVSRLTREVDDPQHIRAFPEKNLVLMHCMLRSWCLHLMYGLGQYVIWSGVIEQVLVITNNIMNLGYTYAKRKINNTPEIIHKLTHIGWLIA